MQIKPECEYHCEDYLSAFCQTMCRMNERIFIRDIVFAGIDFSRSFMDECIMQILLCGEAAARIYLDSGTVMATPIPDEDIYKENEK